MIDDKTEEHENNNEMENNLNTEQQEQPSELEQELNKATSDEDEKETDESNQYTGMTKLELYKKVIKCFKKGDIDSLKKYYDELNNNENVTNQLDLLPNIAQNLEDIRRSSHNANTNAASTFTLLYERVGEIDKFLDNLNNVDIFSLIPKMAEKFIYFELMLSDNFNSIRSRLYDITNLFINKFEPCLIHIGDISERVERIERDIAEIKAQLAGVSPAKKTRAKRKAKTEKTGSAARRSVNKVGAKRGRKPGKTSVANVSHPKRGIKKRGRGRPSANAGRKGRRS